MCAIYIFAVVTAVHPFDILTLQTLEIFIFSIRSWSLCRIMRQDRSNWGQARAVQKKTEFDENWFLCEYATDETTYGTCNNVAQRMELKQRALRDGSFYLWEQSWAQFESGTMRGSRCPTFHFIEVWFRSSFHISYHYIFSTFFYYISTIDSENICFRP